MVNAEIIFDHESKVFVQFCYFFQIRTYLYLSELFASTMVGVFERLFEIVDVFWVCPVVQNARVEWIALDLQVSCNFFRGCMIFLL